ncbi:PAS domain-containing methyl-accepting chemotaxis protein [Methylosinus sp. PW1]|uniref:methyl-accepting chemotaxis protein n=1 Tax=Methylosinus sp. PW1 TaxID=107636 RepID=UPI00055C9A2C|nr:PAS domain-containing methyl-accepting chemotaxis protein [Methylosinus sp. PW1]
MKIIDRLTAGAEEKGVLEALDRSLAIIEFDPLGNVVGANENFCRLLGYAPADIIGRHHRLFVDPAYAAGPDYAQFWAKLGRGEYDAGEYRRIGKDGKEVWLQASYNPVRNSRGQIRKVVKVAADITAEKLKSSENQGRLDAISRAQGVIEFETDGAIISANENFLAVVGYRLDEIKGRHHRMFVDPAYAESAEYREFWSRLNRGEYIAEEFRRIGKGGREIWLQASYIPIFDMDGRVVKVVKFATDVTERVRAVRELGDGLGQLAEGDLLQRIERPFMPALDKLRTDFNAAVDRLEVAIGAVVRGAEVIRAASGEISGASDELAKRTEQQAASLEETSAAVEEITTGVRTTAQGAADAHRIAALASADAKSSGEVVRKAVAAMSRIEKSSSDIGRITGAIDEIAFQTNLLALNAGVEAARAGEAGRGFAVVASEVRALAQRSAEAAKEIKGLISSSSSEVSAGVQLVTQAGQTLAQIVAQVSQINEVVAAISNGVTEQSASLQQVNVAVGQMDQDTQKNAAMVEETTAASHNLRDEAENLFDSVRIFKVSAARRGAGASARTAARIAPPALRTPARGGAAAARKLAVEPANESWEEF